VTPRAGRDEISGWDGDVLRVRVAAPPAEGRANAAVERLIATALGVAPSRVRIAGGGTARLKRVRIEGLELDEVRRLLRGGSGAA
jgi:hypothetical protein